MVLEAILKPKNVLKHPHRVLPFAFIISIFSIGMSFLLFEEYSSIASLAFIILGFLPFVNKVLRIEENYDITSNNEKELLKEHRRAILVFVYLFIGICLSYLLFFLFLPEAGMQTLFSSQIETITRINSVDETQINANAYKDSLSANAISNSYFFQILLNNIKVLVIALLLSFIYSSGALFVMTWNASLIAVAIGYFIREAISFGFFKIGFVTLSNYFSFFLGGITRFFLHGIFEIISYFFAALAGGIISYAIINHHYKSKKFYNIVLDTYDLIIISFIFLILGAIVEVYVSPIIGF